MRMRILLNCSVIICYLLIIMYVHTLTRYNRVRLKYYRKIEFFVPQFSYSLDFVSF